MCVEALLLHFLIFVKKKRKSITKTFSLLSATVVSVHLHINQRTRLQIALENVILVTYHPSLGLKTVCVCEYVCIYI